MIKICALARGWTLYREGGTFDPRFVHKDGRVRNPFEVASLPEAPVLLEVLKKERDYRDIMWKLPGNDAEWRTVDAATFGLNMSLIRLNKYDPVFAKYGIPVGT